MDQAKAAPVRYLRWLPYVAVFQTDLRQTPKNWVWRIWVTTAIVAAVLYLTYRFAVSREAGIVQTMNSVVGNLLHWTSLATVTLVVAFTSAAIANERGSLADSILCRGISRYQYFFAKLHSRLVSVLGTYLVIAGGVLAVAAFGFPGLVTPTGCVAALAALGALLGAIVCCGVTTSALCGSTVMSVTVLWVALYALGFALTFMPAGYLTPDRLIDTLPQMLKGSFHRDEFWTMIYAALVGSGVVTLIGALGFSRADV